MSYFHEQAAAESPWPLLRVFALVPHWIRDPIYSFVARNRYRWFGRQEVCLIPTPEIRARFIG